VDKALDGARTVAAVEQRRASYTKLWEHERDDLPLIYLWAPANIVGLKASITGFRQVPDGLIRLQGMALR
jgi:peptide/nickel transport system substrate-binding protein